jgi:hypothetical protein
LPAKISLANPNEPKPFDPRDVTSYEQRVSGEGGNSICEGCVVDSYSLVADSGGIDEVRVVSDGGMELCRIYLDQGQVVLDECGVATP